MFFMARATAPMLPDRLVSTSTKRMRDKVWPASAGKAMVGSGTLISPDDPFPGAGCRDREQQGNINSF
jgi:hypothetical protein